MIVTIVAALSTAMIATPVMAQNMTGGNMTGGNMTGKISGLQDKYLPPQDVIKCTPPEVEVSEDICGVPQGGGSADTDSGNGGDTGSSDGGEGQGEDGEEQEGGN